MCGSGTWINHIIIYIDYISLQIPSTLVMSLWNFAGSNGKIWSPAVNILVLSMLIKQPIHLTLAEDKFSFTISQAANSLYLKPLNKVFMGFWSFQLLSGLRIVCPNTNSLGLNTALSSLTSLAANPPPSLPQFECNKHRTSVFDGNAPKPPEHDRLKPCIAGREVV